MKRLLIHSLVFGPDGVSTAYLYNDIAAAFDEAGWEVKVVTTTPHFNPPAGAQSAELEASPFGSSAEPHPTTGEAGGPPAIEPRVLRPSGGTSCPADGNIKVIRVPMRRFKHIWSRMLGFVWWHLASFFVILLGKRPDVILSPSPPPTVGLLNVWLGRLKRCKVVYNVQEIYPDILKNLHGLPLKVMRRMERRIYDGSDAVVTIDQVFRDTIAPRFAHPETLHIIPNFVDTELYRPLVPSSPSASRNDRLVLLYAGNVGLAQDWDLLLDLAQKTSGMPVEYSVVGDGLKKDYLLAGIAERHLENISVLPYQPREKMPELLACSDADFIFMNPSMDRQGFPSKVYTIMACARPLIVSSGEDTPIVNFLKGKPCGLLFSNPRNDRSDDIAGYLQGLLEAGVEKARATLREMGASGRELVEEQYSREKVCSRYVELLDSLLK